jgi:hypothetical protein
MGSFSHSHRSFLDQSSNINCAVKPPLSIAALIAEAIQKSPGNALPIQGIYSYIEDCYDYYR